jgi:replicative DNA helicase Mcm
VPFGVPTATTPDPHHANRVVDVPHRLHTDTMSSTTQSADTFGQTERELMECFDRFLRSYYREELGQLVQQYPKNSRSLEIDFHDLWRHDNDLADDYLSNPKLIRELGETALGRVDIPGNSIDDDGNAMLEGAHLRVTNLPDEATFSVGDYRTDQEGEYISVAGQVARRTGVKPRVREAAFECQRCGTYTHVPQPPSDFYEPHECKGCERQGPFEIDTSESDLVDYQTVRLQRPPEESHGGGAESVDVHLADDITGHIEPGDRLETAGVLEMHQSDDDSATFEYFVDAHALELQETSYDEIEIEPHLESIRELAGNDPFEALTSALAPKVYGYEQIKEAIILQLFGGVRAEYPDGSSDRGSIHVMLLGDPGVAKSKLLRAADALAPRSTFASGKGTSAAGLTAGVVSDDFGGERYSLKAGALVQANDGIACIDELDKVDEETRSSLHTALEQQTVEVNKIMEASMPARTSLLAAGNPQYGRFDQYEPIADQITLGPALLSRFDLMFMLQDDVDEQRDEEISDHIIESNNQAIRRSSGGDGDDDGLIDPDVDAELLRAYIAYARQRITPTIEDQSVKRQLRENFTTLRSLGDGDAPVPVTFRKLEAVLRLAQASARVRLSQTVESVDVERAQRLVGQSLRDVGMDPETEQFDADIVETGHSSSQRERKKQIRSIIEELAQEHEDYLAPIPDVIEAAAEAGIEESTVRNDIEKLRQKGIVYEPQSGHVRIA